MAKATLHFPADFRWGTATSAHQVEGGNKNNDWWQFEQDGHIKDDSSSETACDWWEGAEADFDRMADLGHNAHRLSVEWSRVEPQPGQWDQAALDRYRDMVSGLRQRGIEPMVTLHHQTDPLWFVERGGWENSELAREHFPRYVAKVVQALGEHVDLWCTFNEPNHYVLFGWLRGSHPPAKTDFRAGMRALRAIWKSHADAYRLIHELQPKARVGVALHFVVFDPAKADSAADRWAAGRQHKMFNQMPLAALTRGRMPWNSGGPFILGVKGTYDWLGINYFYRRRVTFDLGRSADLYGRMVVPEDADVPIEGVGETYAKGLLRIARWLSVYGCPLYVTENGVADLTDERRPRFLLSHLKQVWHAIQFNYPIKGYYHWTLVDCFQWDYGYSLRFGLIKLDPQTGERTVRPSGELYAEICRANAIDDELVARYDPKLADRMFPG